MLSKYERETIITFNEEEDTAAVYTCSKAIRKKLDSYCTRSTLFNIKREDEYSKEYQIPKRYISIRLPMKISEESRAERAMRAKGLCARRNQAGGNR